MYMLDNFERLLFGFYTFGVRRPNVSPRAPDPVPDLVRILPDPDPGWFSASRTYMVRLTPKVLKQKRMLLILSKIFIQ